jgi:hypothetical protein
MTSVQPQDVIDAWASMKSWVEGKLPGLANSTPIHDRTADVGETSACSLMNMPGQRSIWQDDGDGSVNVTNQVLTISGVAQQDATLATDGTVNLPLSFGHLTVSGRYEFTQACAIWDDLTGKKGQTNVSRDDGSISQVTGNGTVTFSAALGDTVTVSAVRIDAQPTTTVQPDEGDIPGWFKPVEDVITEYMAARFNAPVTVEDATSNVFSSREVCDQLTTVLNAALNPTG